MFPAAVEFGARAAREEFFTARVEDYRWRRVMASEPARLTLQEYLSWEMAQETRHEFTRGFVFAMSGASRAHGTIVMNLSALIRPRLRGTGCDAFASDMRVIPPARTSCRYPDIVVTCDDRDKRDPFVTRHPRLIVEVMSPSTERIDRTENTDEYKSIPELLEYVLVDSQRRRIEIQRRSLERDTWTVYDASRDETLFLASLDTTFAVDAIYEGVDFEAASAYRAEPQT
jgi:Uma2 family endonuclease